MRAMLLHAFGDSSNMRMGETPKPEPGPGQVLIKIAASGINPVDIKIRTLAPAFAPELPGILGMDLAGTVEAVGGGVTDFAPGDEVWGCAGGLKGLPGTLAEYLAVDTRLVGKKPGNLSMRQAAALPLVVITAWMALHERIHLQEGVHVLVHGGTGGVGHVAVQLAKAAGARVAATVSTEAKAEKAKALGADETILYKDESVAEYIKRLTGGRGFDAVFDTVGGTTLDASIEAAALEAVVASTNTRSTHDLSTVHAKALTLSVVFMLLPMATGQGLERYRPILDAAKEMAEAGKLVPLLDPNVFSLENAAKAQDHLEQGKAVGKVVVDVA
jgi:NADPH2:quinone reductase